MFVRPKYLSLEALSPLYTCLGFFCLFFIFFFVFLFVRWCVCSELVAILFALCIRIFCFFSTHVSLQRRFRDLWVGAHIVHFIGQECMIFLFLGTFIYYPHKKKRSSLFLSLLFTLAHSRISRTDRRRRDIIAHASPLRTSSYYNTIERNIFIFINFFVH